MCPSAHTERPWLSISTHISNMVLGLSTLALPVDCLGDFGPRGLSVQYTQDVRGCLPANTGRSWLSVSTHRTSVAVRVCLCVFVSKHRTSVAYTQDVRGCPSAHTRRLWVSVSTHWTSVVVRVCVCQHTQNVHGCPSVHISARCTQDVRGCPSAHPGCPWVSVSTHRMFVAVCVCPCVSVSPHRTSVAVHQYTYQLDVVIRSATEPEEGLSHETNCSGLYAQEGVQSIWNQPKIVTEQEVMNFTTQRFLSPSICEYPTLERDLSSSKEQPEAKPIIGVKRSLSTFQKAKDQEKWPRNYEVMIQSPKPVIPVLHLPQLEANRFNQLQTRH
ncbi:hypothetical protein YC2023_066396 [Brassica napus]